RLVASRRHGGVCGQPSRSHRGKGTPRSSWTSGTDYWVIYWFAASMAGALCFRRWMKVNVGALSSSSSSSSSMGQRAFEDEDEQPRPSPDEVAETDGF